jgi:competence protein ComEC
MSRLKKLGIIFSSAALLTAVVFIGFQFLPAAAVEKPLVVAFLDVGQGDAIFIQAPNGVLALVDGGGSNRVMLELGRLMAFGDNTIDLIIATHPDKDHIGGLIPVLEKFEVSKVIVSPGKNDTKTAALFDEAVSREGAERILAEAGQIVWLDKPRGIYLKIMAPFSADLSGNEASVVAELRYGENEFLLTGDIGQATELALVRIFGEEIKTDILKVAHHGSRYSSASDFLSAAAPAFAVISAGAKNPYGHPHRDTLARLNKLKIPILGTYSEGTIVFESDGVEIRRVR